MLSILDMRMRMRNCFLPTFGSTSAFWLQGQMSFYLFDYDQVLERYMDQQFRLRRQCQIQHSLCQLGIFFICLFRTSTFAWICWCFSLFWWFMKVNYAIAILCRPKRKPSEKDKWNWYNLFYQDFANSLLSKLLSQCWWQALRDLIQPNSSRCEITITLLLKMS